MLNSSETLWLSLLSAKMKKIRSKMKALECSQHYKSNLQMLKGITLESVVVSGQNLNSSKFSCISSLPARTKMIQSKMKELEWSQRFSHYKSMGFFSRRLKAANSAALSLIWPNFEHFRDFMVVLFTCKNEEDPIKDEGASVLTTLYSNFSDAQGQITPKSMVVSGRISNAFKLSCIFSSSVRMKRIQSKMKELGWLQH